MMTIQERDKRVELHNEYSRSGEFKDAKDPATLGSEKANHYLANRLYNAFRAGMDAGRRAYIESLPGIPDPRVDEYRTRATIHLEHSKLTSVRILAENLLEMVSAYQALFFAYTIALMRLEELGASSSSPSAPSVAKKD